MVVTYVHGKFLFSRLAHLEVSMNKSLKLYSHPIITDKNKMKHMYFVLSIIKISKLQESLQKQQDRFTPKICQYNYDIHN